MHSFNSVTGLVFIVVASLVISVIFSSICLYATIHLKTKLRTISLLIASVAWGIGLILFASISSIL